MKNMTAYIEKDVESVMYIGIIPSLIGAHTCAETLDELHIKLQEVAELCIECMSKLKLINAMELERFLLQLGFERVRQKWSRHSDGRTTTIPFHLSKDLPHPLIRTILNEINVTVEDYNKLA